MTELKLIAPRVWGAETRVAIGAGAVLPLRMTVIRDDQGAILISPIEIDPPLRTAIDALGPVHTIIAPNLLHHRWLGDAKAQYPAARVLAPSGLRAKRPDLAIDGDLRSGPVLGDLSATLLEGAPKLSELVLFHEPSKTLIVTDLVFNIPEASGMTWMILKVFSRALGKVEQSRLLRMFTKDRAAAGRSVEAILRLPFECVVPAHGDVIDVDAKAQLAEGTRWMRGHPRESSAAG